jgi:ERCC4-type nuclease
MLRHLYHKFRQGIFSERNQKGMLLSQLIQRVQKIEGEKLVLVAARHLDLIRGRFPALATQMGLPILRTDDPTYISTKIHQCEHNISELMEEIQSEKLELLEGSEEGLTGEDINHNG